MALRYERQNTSQDFEGCTVFVDKQGLHTLVAEDVVLIDISPGARFKAIYSRYLCLFIMPSLPYYQVDKVHPWEELFN